MGQSNVPFNDNASASRKFHTYQRSNGTDTVEEYVQAVAEPYLATYNVPIGSSTSLATANSHIIQIMAGASLRVGIRRITLWQYANGTAATAAWYIYRLTTAGTGGSAITPTSFDPADAASGATAMTLPSSKGTEGSLVMAFSVTTIATAATAGLRPVLDIDFSSMRNKALWIAAGTSNGIAVKAVDAVAGTGVLGNVTIVESAEGA